MSLPVLLVAAGLPAKAVESLAGGGGREPRAGIRRDAVVRPAFDGGRERLGGGILRRVEVTETPGQGGDHPGPILAVSLGDRLLDDGFVTCDRGRPRLAVAAQLGHDSSIAWKDSSVWKGRTSTLPRQAFEPPAAGRSATSRSGASMIQKPPRYSLDSRYGPSVKTGWSP